MTDRHCGKALRVASVGIALAVASMLMVSTVAPQPAYAAEETRVYTWGANESRPNIPNTIEVNGETLTLQSTSDARQTDASSTSSQLFRQSVDGTCAPDQVNNLQSIVASTFNVNSDGYNGTIPRTRIDYAPVYTTVTDTVTDSRTTMTTSNDPNLLARTVTKDGRQLNFVGATFEVAETDSSGNPILYQATANYSGDFNRDVIDHYNYTAYYEGTLTRVASAGEWSVSCVYASQSAAVVAAETLPGGEGVTATFADVDSFDTLESNTNTTNEENTEAVATNVSNTNTSSNTNTNTSGNTEPTTETTTTSTGLPLPLLIGGGVALAAIAGGIVLVLRLRKKADEPAPVEAAPIPVPEEDEEEIECELIEYFDGDNQETIALLDVDPSSEPNTPTYIYIPAPPNEFVPASGAEYYVALSDTSSFVSPSMVVMANNHEIYNGMVEPQLQLDVVELVNALNDNGEGLDERLDLTSELQTFASQGAYAFDGEDIQEIAEANTYAEPEPELDEEYLIETEDLDNYDALVQEEAENVNDDEYKFDDDDYEFLDDEDNGEQQNDDSLEDSFEADDAENEPNGFILNFDDDNNDMNENAFDDDDEEGDEFGLPDLSQEEIEDDPFSEDDIFDMDDIEEAAEPIAMPPTTEAKSSIEQETEAFEPLSDATFEIDSDGQDDSSNTNEFDTFADELDADEEESNANSEQDNKEDDDDDYDLSGFKGLVDSF